MTSEPARGLTAVNAATACIGDGSGMIPRPLVILCAAALLSVQQACSPAGTRAATGDRDQTAAPNPGPVRQGDAVPDCTLTGHDGKKLSLSSRQPRAVLLTFIFTRCHAMEFCPRMSQKFAEMRKALDASPWKDGVELVSVTLDPEHDTPEVLAACARGLEARAGSWTFAACPRDVLERLKCAFGVRAAMSGETGAIEHNLVTVLIDARGRLHRTWEGNTWTSAEVMAELLSAAAANAPGS